jgi:glutaredoxin
MNIPSPTSDRFTVYTKQNCSYCEKVKDELERCFETPEIIPCDDFLTNDFLTNDFLTNDFLTDSNTKKRQFVTFMNSLTKDKFKTFPVVFFDKTFIGGYNETVLYLQK